jgi:hypothetical protein
VENYSSSSGEICYPEWRIALPGVEIEVENYSTWSGELRYIEWRIALPRVENYPTWSGEILYDLENPWNNLHNTVCCFPLFSPGNHTITTGRWGGGGGGETKGKEEGRAR